MRIRPRWLAACALLTLLALLSAPLLGKVLTARGILVGLAEASAPDKSQRQPRVVRRDAGWSSGGEALRARFYSRAEGGSGPVVVVAHGVHHEGIDEPRLVAFVEELARAGLVVFTPEIRDLTHYRITERSVRDVVAATKYVAEYGSSDGQVGLIGFSFAGGLSLLAGADPDAAQHLRFVASIGGHHDLSRVLQFFLDDSVETPSGVVKLRSHEYGLVVLTYECLSELLPAAEVPLASKVLEAWLQEDRVRARELMTQASSVQSEQLFKLLEDGQLSRLQERLQSVLAQRHDHLERLSPSGKLGQIAIPVYLLHGAGDSVIPASETQWAGLELGAKDHVALVSPLIQHVELRREPSVVDELRLLGFMTHLL